MRTCVVGTILGLRSELRVLVTNIITMVTNGSLWAVAMVGIMVTTKCKGKSVPLQAWTGPEGSRKLRLPDFVTTAQDGGKFVSLTHRPPLPPGNTPGIHFC